LRYETWHFIHLYTYLAIALAFSHQFATGAEFVSSRPARVFWSLLYLAVAAILLWFRLIAPVVGSLRHDLRVAQVVVESPTVLSVYIRGRHLEDLRAEAGQFFRWRFLTRELWWAANPYSLSLPPHPQWLRITVKASGEHSLALARLAPGTRVIAEGPSGGFTAGRRRRQKVLMIAGGVGITPLRALFETLPGGPGDIVLLYRVNTVADLVLRPELEDIARSRGAALHCLVGPPRTGANDHLAPQRLRRLVPDVVDRDVFLCGPEPMMDAARASLRSLGVPRSAVHSESFVF
jgi:ferredoxin-NADP reductase